MFLRWVKISGPFLKNKWPSIQEASTMVPNHVIIIIIIEFKEKEIPFKSEEVHTALENSTLLNSGKKGTIERPLPDNMTHQGKNPLLLPF